MPIMFDSDAYWLVPKEGRESFKKGVHMGLAVSAGVIVAAIAAPVLLTSLPAWGLYYAGALATSVLVSASYDASNSVSSVELVLGEAVAKNPELMGETKANLYKKGFVSGIKRSLKGLGVDALIAPFAPVLLPASYLLDKGTNGRKWFSWKPCRTPEREKELEDSTRLAFFQETSPAALEFQRRSLTGDFKSAASVPVKQPPAPKPPSPPQIKP